MKRFMVAAGLLIAFAIPAVAFGNPPHDNKNGPHKDYISGAADVPLPTPLGTVPAHITSDGTTKPNGHSGDQATGTWSTDFFGTAIGDVHLAGTILCINAVRAAENGANWRGVITSSNTTLAPVGFGVLSRNVDNGDGPPDDPPDRNIGVLTAPPGPHPTCPGTPMPTNAITSGNLVVHDGGF
jgi:hypothetical protein